MTVATVVATVCFNAYVMDYIKRPALGACETLMLFYSGADRWPVSGCLADGLVVTGTVYSFGCCFDNPVGCFFGCYALATVSSSHWAV